MDDRSTGQAQASSTRSGSRHLFTIGRKVGAVFFVLIGVWIVMCFVVLYQLAQVRRDAGKLLEETREAELGMELVSTLQHIENIFETMPLSPPGLPETHARTLEELRQARNTLEQLARGPTGEDPSRAEHQASEMGMAARIGQRLQSWEEGIHSPTGAEPHDALDQELRQTRELAEVLKNEMKSEWSRSSQDLKRRIGQVRSLMFFTPIGASLLLLVVLWLVLRTIVVPLRLLRRGSEQIGQGQLEHRIRIQSHDEIGDLALEFNRMASQLSKSRGELEEEVRERTLQFIQAAKFASLGTLAAGVAHEINNPIASIASCAEGLERRVRTGGVDADEQIEYLETIAGEAYRVHRITARLLDFARQEPGPLAEVRPVEVLGEIELMLRHQLEQQELRLVLDLPAELPEVHCNGSDLKQVLINLLINAMDASEQGGVIWLRARQVDSSVVLEVQDHGHGVAKEDRESIFDPFYTTKAPGLGTGLGLALAYRIVDSCGGTIELEDPPEGGALFRVTLPLSSVRAA
ncbi:MAG: sensor histidine kinase [Planctomycetota bacterium]